MASTIKNEQITSSKSDYANPAYYGLGFVIIFTAIAFALLQLLPFFWFDILKIPASPTSKIALAVVTFALGIFALVTIGKNKLFTELNGLKAAVFIGFVLILLNLVVFSWWGKFSETLVFEKGFFPESFGISFAIAGCAVFIIASLMFFVKPSNLKLFKQIEEQGWFSRESFKHNQGPRIRRGTILCLLVLFGTGIYVLVKNETLSRGGNNLKVEIPFTARVNINPDKTGDTIAILETFGYKTEQPNVSRQQYRLANQSVDANNFVKIGLLTGDSKYKSNEIVSKEFYQEESRELTKNDRKPAESSEPKTADGNLVYQSIILIPGTQFSVPILLIIIGIWISWRIVNIPVFADFLIATEAEMNKVSWTTNKKLFHDTIVVLTTLVLMSVFLFAMDQFWRIFLSKAGVLRFGQDNVQKNTSVDLKKW